MPANTSPIFTITPEISWPSINPIGTASTMVTSTVSNNYDGTTSALLLFSAGPNGSFIQKVILEAAGTNTSQAVIRLFINNGNTNTVASNNSLIGQYTLAATTASNSISTAHVEIPLMMQIPSPYRIYILISSSAANTGGWYATAIGGDY